MSSPLDTDPAEEWFRRFDATLRRLPVEERVRQHEEMQQHLEGLVTAHESHGQSYEEAWKAALAQFGDPTQIGRKMYQEWQQGRTGFRTDIKAILFGLSLILLLTWVIFPLVTLLWTTVWLFWMRFHSLGSSNGTAPHLSATVIRAIGFGGTLLICFAIGRKYPIQAIKAALYSSLIGNLVLCLEIIVLDMHIKAILQPLLAMIAHILLWAPAWALGHAVIAYLASITRRGWYRPLLADFKLGLPHRRTQLSR